MEELRGILGTFRMSPLILLFLKKGTLLSLDRQQLKWLREI